jgi:hypothetical protein
MACAVTPALREKRFPNFSTFVELGVNTCGQDLHFYNALVAVRAAFVSRTPAWVQLWVHYGSNKRCVGLFPAL